MQGPSVGTSLNGSTHTAVSSYPYVNINVVKLSVNFEVAAMAVVDYFHVYDNSGHFKGFVENGMIYLNYLVYNKRKDYVYNDSVVYIISYYVNYYYVSCYFVTVYRVLICEVYRHKVLSIVFKETQRMDRATDYVVSVIWYVLIVNDLDRSVVFT